MVKAGKGRAPKRSGLQQNRPKQRLTDSIVKKLPPPAKGYTVFGDTEVPGFAVRVTANGARSYVISYYTRAGRDRCYTIGSASVWSAVAARNKARELRRDIEDGGDPLADIEAERAAPTVAQLIERFREEHLPRKRPRTAADYEQLIKNHIAPHFGQHVKVADVRFEDIDALHRKVTKTGATYTANRCVAVVSKMFSLAVRWHMRETNPAKGIERNTEFTRRRYLSGDELGRLVAALNTHPDKQAANIIRILLLTGCRRGEAMSMRHADVDLRTGVWSKPPSSTKQKEHHQVPLSAPALQILSDIQAEQARKHRHGLPTYVFPGPGESGHVVEIKRAWRNITKTAGITGLRVHDLRHSHASFLVSGGASLPLIGAMLGHSNPQTTARYSHLHQDPMRAAAERIGSIVENAGKPVPEPAVLKRGRGP
jgi:integrase